MWIRKKGLILVAGAWVVWSQLTSLRTGKSEEWETVGGYDVYIECLNVVNVLSERERQRREADKTTAIRASYQCLPDTIDPRAPKTTKDKN